MIQIAGVLYVLGILYESIVSLMVTVVLVVKHMSPMLSHKELELQDAKKPMKNVER